eukprot:g2513.t1
METGSSSAFERGSPVIGDSAGDLYIFHILEFFSLYGFRVLLVMLILWFLYGKMNEYMKRRYLQSVKDPKRVSRFDKQRAVAIRRSQLDLEKSAMEYMEKQKEKKKVRKKRIWADSVSKDDHHRPTNSGLLNNFGGAGFASYRPSRPAPRRGG